MASTSTRRISGCRPRSSTSTYLVGKKIASKIYLENGHCVLYHEPSDTYRFHSRIHRRAAEKMFPEDVPTASITGRDGVMTEAIRDGVITEDGVMTEAIRDRVYTDAELPNWQVRGPGTWPRCLGAPRHGPGALRASPAWPGSSTGIWGTEGQPGVHPNEIRPHQVPLATPAHTRITFNVCSPHAGDPEYRSRRGYQIDRLLPAGQCSYELPLLQRTHFLDRTGHTPLWTALNAPSFSLREITPLCCTVNDTQMYSQRSVVSLSFCETWAALQRTTTFRDFDKR